MRLGVIGVVAVHDAFRDFHTGISSVSGEAGVADDHGEDDEQRTEGKRGYPLVAHGGHCSTGGGL